MIGIAPVKTVTLSRPVVYRGKEWTEVAASIPKIGQRRMAEIHYNSGNSPFADTMYQADLVLRCIGMNEKIEFLDMLDGAQVEELYAWINTWLPGGENCTAEVQNGKLILRTPISVKGITYDEIALHEPLFAYKRKAMGYLKNAQRPFHNTQAACAIVGFCTGAPPEVVDQFDVDQFEAAWSWIVPFLTPGQATGST